MLSNCDFFLDYVIYCVGGCASMEAWNEMLLGKWTIELGNDEGKDLLQLLFGVDVGPKVAGDDGMVAINMGANPI